MKVQRRRWYGDVNDRAPGGNDKEGVGVEDTAGQT